MSDPLVATTEFGCFSPVGEATDEAEMIRRAICTAVADMCARAWWRSQMKRPRDSTLFNTSERRRRV